MRVVGKILAVLFVVVLVGTALILLWYGGFGFIIAVAGGVATVLGLIRRTRRGAGRLWRWGSPQKAKGRPTMELVDNLADEVQQEWAKEAGGRGLLSPAPLPIWWELAASGLQTSVDGAIGIPGQRRRFPTLPGIDDVDKPTLSTGGGREELHRVFGGLASGRLVIAGEPGAGKTSAGIMLLLDTLAHRAELSDDERARVPVPVIVRLSDWNPHLIKFNDWLAREITTSYYPGRDQGIGKGLVDYDRVAAIVDGLDEISDELRPAALAGMSAAQTRIVLLTRTAELAAAAHEGGLVDAVVVELCSVNAARARSYLGRAMQPPPANLPRLLDTLRTDPNGNLARALRTPLMLALLRDTYRAGDDVSDLLDASRTSVDGVIEKHLLGRIVTATYKPRPDKELPRYRVDEADRALTFIAERMRYHRTDDIAWWSWPRWARWPRLLTALPPQFLVVGAASLTALLLILPAEQLAWAFYGVGVVAASRLAYGKGPRRISRLRWRTFLYSQPPELRRHFVRTPVVMLIALVVGFALFGWQALVAIGIALIVVLGFDAIFALSLANEVVAVSPHSLWRADQLAGLLYGSIAGLIVGVWVAFIEGLAFRNPLWWYPVILVLFVLIGAMFGWLSCTAFTAALAAAYIGIRQGVPLRLLRFLEDAHGRGVLRTVGPVYQFRHERLQSYLASQQGQ